MLDFHRRLQRRDRSIRRDLEALWLAAAAAALLALGGPGVEARADAPAAEVAGDAESCRVPDAAAERRSTAQAMAQLQARLAADAERAPEDVVVLNGRGYNYDRERRVDPVRELQVLRRDEAAQAAREDTSAH